MKLAIIVQNGTLTGKKLEFSEGIFTVGRAASCQLMFNPTAENMVSTRHASIEAKSDGFYLIDNKSTNGTFVNGKSIQIIKLNSGDIIQFGKNGPEAQVSIDFLTQHQSSASEATFVLNQSQESQPTIVNPNQPLPLQPPSFQQNYAQNSEPTIVQPKQPQFPQQPVQSYNPPPIQEANSPQLQPTQLGNVGQFQLPQVAGVLSNQPAGLRNSLNYIGLGNPNIGIKPDNTHKYIGLTAVIVFSVFLLIVIRLVVADLGIIIAVLASIIAFIPAGVYILPLLGIDRYDPEPPWLLALAFGWGALIAVVVSYFINSGVGRIAYIATRDPQIADLVSAVVSAPIFEESSKGLGVLLILILFRKYFDDILDGIVYGGVVALGFATVENVFYYGRGFKEGFNSERNSLEAGLAALLILFVVRGILSPFAHVLFTSMTGIGCGISRESHKGFIKILMPFLGYITAVFLHALWNGMSILIFIVMKNAGLLGVCSDIGLGGDGTGHCVFIIGYGILEVPVFLIFVIFTIYIMRRQNRILKEMLALDVARGVITQEHLDIATSVFRSTKWSYGSIFSGKYLARSRYLRAIGKYGLSYWHMQRATNAQGQTASFQQNPILRDEVLKWREQV